MAQRAHAVSCIFSATAKTTRGCRSNETVNNDNATGGSELGRMPGEAGGM